MKDLKQLQRMAANPFYTMSKKEMEDLEKLQAQEQNLEVTPEKKESVYGSAVVKETGKLNKHISDPVEG
jgi:hypothetical protein